MYTTPRMCMCVCMCVWVYVCDTTAFYHFSLDIIAVCYIFDEAMYICIDAIGLHTLHLAWLPLLHPDSHSRVIETCYSYAHTLQTHQTTNYQIRTA